MSELSKRITQAIYAELRRQADSGDGPSVNPAIGVDEFDGIAHIEGEVDLAAAAEAVARDLKFQEEWAPAYWRESVFGGGGYVDPDTQWAYESREPAQKRAAIFDQPVACRYVTDWRIADA